MIALLQLKQEEMKEIRELVEKNVPYNDYQNATMNFIDEHRHELLPLLKKLCKPVRKRKTK